jgi:hypothetical protein
MIRADDARILREVGARPKALALSSNGELLARNDADGSLVVEGVADGTAVKTLDGREIGDLRALMLSPRGAWLVAIGGTKFGTFMFTGHAEEHAVVWKIETGERMLLPRGTVIFGDYEQQIGPMGDQALLLAALVWNDRTRQFGGRQFPSLLSFWSVPFDEVGTQLRAWQLSDDGVREIYSMSTTEILTPTAMSSVPGVWSVQDNQSRVHFIDMNHDHLIGASCAALPRQLTAVEQQGSLPLLRRPMGCPPADLSLSR